MSLIVVEGVDASGKSTLCENLRTIRGRYFLLIRHSCRPLRGYDVTRALSSIEAGSSNLDVILDRHPLISEPVYGPILRGANLIDDVMTKDQAARRLQRTVDRVIYCRPSTADILLNLSNRPQLAGVSDNFGKLVDAYDERIEEIKRHVPVIVYNYKVPVDFETLAFGDLS